MSKRDSKRLPHDFHLWMAVAETVEPLRRKRLMKFGAGPLPLPPEPAAETPPSPPKAGKPKHRAPALPPYQAPLPSAPRPDKSIEPTIRKKVTRGRIAIDGTIDLHGMRQDEARAALHRFIHARAAQGERTILVITGKGISSGDDYMAAMTQRGVLRTMLPIWLSEPSLAPLISGWTVAARGHGGEGAWYVRIRPRRHP